MLSKRDLYQAYYQGNSDDTIRKEILRYGKIVSDYSIDDDTGHWREYIIKHEETYWNLILHNGRTEHLYWSYSY